MTISKELKWNSHVSNVCTKANKTLGFLRRNLSSCPNDVNLGNGIQGVGATGVC